MRPYLIFEDRPAYPYNKTLGNRHFNAYQTHNQPWSVLRELLPPTVVNYSIVEAESKLHAKALAELRWA